jgi:hypothetical protein
MKKSELRELIQECIQEAVRDGVLFLNKSEQDKLAQKMGKKDSEKRKKVAKKPSKSKIKPPVVKKPKNVNIK